MLTGQEQLWSVPTALDWHAGAGFVLKPGSGHITGFMLYSSTCVSGPSTVWLQAAFPVLSPGTSFLRSLQLWQNHSSQNLPPFQKLRPWLTQKHSLLSIKSWPILLVLSPVRLIRSSSCCPWSCYPHPVCTVLNAACRPEPLSYLQHVFQAPRRWQVCFAHLAVTHGGGMVPHTKSSSGIISAPEYKRVEMS